MGLLTVSEVAQRLRLHEMTVRRHIRSGQLPAVRVGRRIRVREEDLAEFVRPQGVEGAMTPEQLRDKIFAPPSSEELARRRDVLAEMDRLREEIGPIGISTATLVRVARRQDEVVYGGKTWQELIDEES